MRLRTILLIVVLSLLAAGGGLVVSLRLNGPGPLLGTAAGRWLAERITPARLPAGSIPASDGDLIGQLKLTDLDGNARQLPVSSSHRVLINVWASWCGPCRDEMPVLAMFAREQGVKGIQVIGVAQDDSEQVRSYLLQTPVNYPILLDDVPGHAGIRLGNRLGVLPYTVLIDSNGRLVRRKYGAFASARALTAWASAP